LAIHLDPVTAETVRNYIRWMTPAERERLGLMLAETPLLPGWQVISANVPVPAPIPGLSPQQRQLVAHLDGDNGGRRDAAVIRHLWSRESARIDRVRLRAKQRDRLRVLTSKTNDKLAMVNHHSRIRQRRHTLSLVNVLQETYARLDS